MSKTHRKIHPEGFPDVERDDASPEHMPSIRKRAAIMASEQTDFPRVRAKGRAPRHQAGMRLSEKEAGPDF